MAAEALGTSLTESYGYVTSCGSTEGILWGLYLARRHFKALYGINPVIYYSDQAHYAVAKCLDIMQADGVSVRTHDNGMMDLKALEVALEANKEASRAHGAACRPAVVFANLGSTFLGAVDDVSAIKALLTRLCPDQHFIFGDGALLGLLLPFAGVDQGKAVRCDFTTGLDAVAMSGHKLLGSPQPCSIVLMRRSFMPPPEHKVLL